MSLTHKMAGPEQPTVAPRSITLAYIIAGSLLVAVGVLHLAVMAAHPYWSDWLQRGLWSAGTTPEPSFTGFWAMPGSFAIPLILLGYLVVRLAVKRLPLPSAIGWCLLIWTLSCVYLIGPSGFILILIPGVLLIVADLGSRRHRPDKV